MKLGEFAKDYFKDTSSDLEDSLAEVEEICCGLGSSERSEVLPKPNRFFQPQLSYPLSQNLYPWSYPLQIHIVTWDAITRTKYLVGWRYLRLG